MASNRTGRRNALQQRDAANTAKPPQDAPATDQEQAAPDSTPEEVQPEQPAQEATFTQLPEEPPVAEPDAPEEPEQGTPEDTPPAETPDAAPEDTPAPEQPGGYTPPPDPETEPVMRMEPQPEPAPAPEPENTPEPEPAPEQPPATFAGRLAAAANVALMPETRWAALVQAGVMLVARLARTPEGEGEITYVTYDIPGANGSGPARMYALAQVLYLLGMDMVGRIITHDNTAKRPGHMRITTYAELAQDTLAFLEAAIPVLDIHGNAARVVSRDRRKRLGISNGTYDDNLAERAALREHSRKLAQDIARATTAEELTPQEQGQYVHHVQRLIANAAAALKHERHYAREWDLPQNLGGYPVPDMFAGVVPALADATA